MDADWGWSISGRSVSSQLGPGWNGLELYREIEARLGALPCSIISADRAPQLRQDCKAMGLNFLQKPLERQKLAQFLADSATTAR